ncbi:MAG: hypothetical protein K5751_13900 [Treponemataceae bacterium]|nr:hypothetical protein [Treponemataceae bacterium]
MASTTPFQKFLIYILISIVVSIIALSVILAASGALRKPGNVSGRNGSALSAGENSGVASGAASGADNYDFAVFDGIGTLRLSTCDEEPVPIVLSVYFYYPTDDSLYYEELSTKTRSLKAIVTNYFAGQTKEQLQKRGESTVKAQLKNLLNKELVLGKIDALYFGEYLFFD